MEIHTFLHPLHMKKLFYIGILLLVAFELANIYFIMPMPGSQKMDTVGLAHFLYTWRWVFRCTFGMVIGLSLRQAWEGRKWMLLTATGLAGIAIAFVNLKMSADKMFLQPTDLRMEAPQANAIGNDKLVIGIEYNGEARAYPLQLIAYHHQVLDSIQGKKFMITYCSVCRSGRVFEPMVNGQEETFRLVGMDHFNAMFEDLSTGTWWRQATGEAVAGKLKGQSLPEWPALQTSLSGWLSLHPDSRIMQPDPQFADEYAGLADFEAGTRSGGLTGTDTASWSEKSWVVGIEVDGKSKAFDWNRLKRERIIHDQIGAKPILLVLAADDHSFFALERPMENTTFTLHKDTLVAGQMRYRLDGNAFAGDGKLNPILAYQEFWHSWRTFHPGTERI
jgi:hypothetical protein